MFILLISLMSFSSLAAELIVARITSDIDRNLTEFFIEVDSASDIHSIRIKSTTPSGQIFEDFSYTAEQVLAGGVVLHVRDGHKAVRLKVEKDFNIKAGGGVLLEYLYNGINGTRYSLPLKLMRNDGSFSLRKVTGEPLNRLFFRANRHRILGIIGVREIILSQE